MSTYSRLGTKVAKTTGSQTSIITTMATTQTADCMVESFNYLQDNLGLASADAPKFAQALTSLGFRIKQILPREHLLDLRPVSELHLATNAWQKHQNEYTYTSGCAFALGTILQQISIVSPPVGLALRNELRDVLAVYTGPVVPVTIYGTDGTVSVNAVLWCQNELAEPGLENAIGFMLSQFMQLPNDDDCGTEVEGSICEFYSEPGREADGVFNELLAADWEINVDYLDEDFIWYCGWHKPEMISETMRRAQEYYGLKELENDTDWLLLTQVAKECAAHN